MYDKLIIFLIFYILTESKQPIIRLNNWNTAEQLIYFLLYQNINHLINN